MADNTSISLNEVYGNLFHTLYPGVNISHVPYFLAVGLAILSETKASLINPKNSPLLTKDIAKQFINESTLSIEKIKREINYNPQLSNIEGFRDLKTWVDSIGGLETYLRNYKSSSWEGKLIIY